MATNDNHLVHITFDQKMAEGTRKHLTGITSLPVGSGVLTPAQIAAIFDERAAAGVAVQAATAARTATVKAFHDKRAQTASFVSAYRRVVLGMFSESPDTLAAFGLQPPKSPKKTVATKAEAVAKNEATRKARNTMGKKAKLAIKGTVTAAAPNVGTAPAPSPQPPVTATAPAAPVAPPAPAPKPAT
jgi:hypothetical protein